MTAGSLDETQQFGGRDVCNAGQNPGPRVAGRAAMAAGAILASRSASAVPAPLKVQGSLVYARRGNPRRIA